MKHKCGLCDKKAVWYYMPADSGMKNRYYCDDCIERGCSCNIIPGTDEEKKDKRGRLLPCIEYSYNRLGFKKQ